MEKLNKVILVLLFVLLVLIVSSSSGFANVSDNTLKLYNGDEWNEYRLGDVYNGYQHVYDSNHPENVLYHKYKFKDSIANEYINKNVLNHKNTNLLLDIINNRTKDKNSYTDTLFLHIRVGDVICDFDHEYIKQVNGPLTYAKVGDKSWWNGVLKYIKSNGIKKVVIISGTHMNKCIKESSSYLLDRKKFLKERLPYLNVSFRLAQSPDKDLLTCAYVDHFITTGGGYGNLIKEINKELK